jgi:hypothetical protein
MSDIGSFGSTARGLAKNPLGIIALFIVLIYGFAALTLGFSGSVQPAERIPLVWFLVIFPLIVLATFGWLVSSHHEKLYSPDDFKSDDGFLRGMESRAKHTRELQQMQKVMKDKVRETVNSSPEFAEHESLQSLVEKINKEIDKATTISVDARKFLDDDTALYVFPVAAFESLGDLTNEVYYKLRSKVQAFEYGHSWMLRNRETGDVVKTMRMIKNAKIGKPFADSRSLEDVGVHPGTTLCVESPRFGNSH